MNEGLSADTYHRIGNMSSGDWEGIGLAKRWAREHPYKPLRYDRTAGVTLEYAALDWRAGRVSREEFAAQICDFWLIYGLALKPVRIRQLLWEVGFYSDTGEPPPSESLTVFRGVCETERGWRGLRGLSWTLIYEVAARFMDTSLGGSARLYAAEILPVGVLAILRGRGEAEVLVDARRLRGLRVEDEV
jgi:hypothetical protein